MEPITLTIPVELVMVVAILVAFFVASPLILRMTARLKPLPRMGIFLGSLDMELPQAVLVDTADQPIPQQAHDLRVRRFFFLLNEFLNSYKIQLVFAPQTQISCRQRKT